MGVVGTPMEKTFQDDGGGDGIQPLFPLLAKGVVAGQDGSRRHSGAALIPQYHGALHSVGQALGGVLMPGVVKLVESGAGPRELQNEMIRIGRYAFTMLGLIFVGFLVNGRSFIRLWAGAEYEQGYYVALMLMFAHMIIMTQSIGTQILWAKNKHQLQSVIKFVIVAGNILLTIFLIRWDPLMGAAIGTVISLLLGDVLSMNIVFKKEIGISLKAYYTGLFKGILPCLLLSALAGTGVKLLPVSGLPGLILNVLVMRSRSSLVLAVLRSATKAFFSSAQ